VEERAPKVFKLKKRPAQPKVLEIYLARVKDRQIFGGRVEKGQLF
jgi:hypothetical protein